FFQAEDGIRDFHVTGVQTCALPISSGCGKSTLLSILGLLDSPTEGRYILNGKEVADLPLSERARVRNREIGFIFQSFNLIGDLRSEERRVGKECRARWSTEQHDEIS